MKNNLYKSLIFAGLATAGLSAMEEGHRQYNLANPVDVQELARANGHEISISIAKKMVEDYLKREAIKRIDFSAIGLVDGAKAAAEKKGVSLTEDEALYLIHEPMLRRMAQDGEDPADPTAIKRRFERRGDKVMDIKTARQLAKEYVRKQKIAKIDFSGAKHSWDPTLIAKKSDVNLTNSEADEIWDSIILGTYVAPASRMALALIPRKK